MGLFHIVTCLKVSRQDTRLENTGKIKDNRIKDKKNLDKKINGYKIKIKLIIYLNI